MDGDITTTSGQKEVVSFPHRAGKEISPPSVAICLKVLFCLPQKVLAAGKAGNVMWDVPMPLLRLKKPGGFSLEGLTPLLRVRLIAIFGIRKEFYSTIRLA